MAKRSEQGMMRIIAAPNRLVSQPSLLPMNPIPGMNVMVSDRLQTSIARIDFRPSAATADDPD